MAPFDDQATQAGALVVRLLNGTPPTAIARSSFVNVPVVDWRALRRWRIDEHLLPANADVRFREPTAWDRYRLQIAIGIAVLVIQAALIAALLLERRSRRRTASALEESQKQMNLAARAARLSMWIWDVARDQILGDHSIAGKTPACRTRRRSRSRMSFKEVHPADREELDRRREEGAGDRRGARCRVPRAGPDGDSALDRGARTGGEGKRRGTCSASRSTSPSASCAELRAETGPRRAATHDPRIDAGAALRLDRAPAEPAARGDPRQCRSRAKDAGPGRRRSGGAARDLQRHRERGSSGGRRLFAGSAHCTSAAT